MQDFLYKNIKWGLITSDFSPILYVIFKNIDIKKKKN